MDDDGGRCGDEEHTSGEGRAKATMAGAAECVPALGDYVVDEALAEGVAKGVLPVCDCAVHAESSITIAGEADMTNIPVAGEATVPIDVDEANVTVADKAHVTGVCECTVIVASEARIMTLATVAVDDEATVGTEDAGDKTSDGVGGGSGPTSGKDQTTARIEENNDPSTGGGVHEKATGGKGAGDVAQAGPATRTRYDFF